ncbi:uncharacterized protein BDW47DRAFT_88015 [Aspergillus candidus]|uniref:Uncharacterized protein n=1 Tax=Aspergillus candidus TaxID=41067 RepID=A0A2I2FIM1_ASPCN|nr:hypothetical protein BDW47DRAFT_88015 [Aspergillus candidus]PLB40459.1 hypothetical protein BDW47DRAFT_88015 [Aspergillus candidus]
MYINLSFVTAEKKYSLHDTGMGLAMGWSYLSFFLSLFSFPLFYIIDHHGIPGTPIQLHFITLSKFQLRISKYSSFHKIPKINVSSPGQVKPSKPSSKYNTGLDPHGPLHPRSRTQPRTSQVDQFV